jgi:uncharacterized RDD family membrane protein YckC
VVPGYAYPPTYPSEGYVQPAGVKVDVMGRRIAAWWRRLLAILIDFTIFAVIDVTFAFIFVAIFGTTTVGNGGNGSLGPGLGPVGKFLFNATVGGLALVYFGIFDGGTKGRTVGKMALGIATRDAGTGGPVGPGRAIVRRLIIFPTIILNVIPVVGVTAGIISLLWVLVCALSPLWNSRRQGLHDNTAKTVVIRVG